MSSTKVSNLYLTPALIKPQSKVLTWTIPMCYVQSVDAEYISEYAKVVEVLEKEVPFDPSGELMTMKTDMVGRAMQFKVNPSNAFKQTVPIDAFVKVATKDREVGQMRGEYNLLGKDAVSFVHRIFKSIKNINIQEISPPLHWLVYHPDLKLITRLYYVTVLKGDIVIRPYTSRSLLLEIHGDLEFMTLENTDIETFKKSIMRKIIINQEWQSLVTEAVAEALATELGIESYFRSESKPEVKPEESSGKVGSVE